MRDLAAACAELREQLEVFDEAEVTSDQADGGLPTTGVLIADQDVEPGVGRRPVPDSRLPGNVAVLLAAMDARELVRRLEASLKLAVAGHPGRARGGSDGNTTAALKAIPNLGAALPQERRDEKGRLVWPCQELAARLIERAIRNIGQLPAVDTAVKWTKIHPTPGQTPPACPNCHTFSLRVNLSAGIVICLFPDCEDMDGRRPPTARMDVSRLDGRPVLVWRDGLVMLYPANPGTIS